MSTARKCTLSAYDGQRLLGRIEITARPKRLPLIKAINANGKWLGRFKSQKAAFRAISAANEEGVDISTPGGQGKRDIPNENIPRVSNSQSNRQRRC